MKSANITKKSDIEHLHLRKAFYIGSCSTSVVPMWVLDNNQMLKFDNVEYNVGYFKLIYEIIDNSIDEYIKTSGKYSTKIDITISNDGTIRVVDNGRGISSKKDKETGKYQTELAFCYLKSGSNWDRDSSIGMNGVGASAVNMFSTKFIVNSCDGVYNTKLISLNNTKDITTSRTKSKKRGTSVEFKLDNSHFENVEMFTPSMIEKIVTKRIIELRTAYPKIHFSINGVNIIKNIWDCFSSDPYLYIKPSINILFLNKTDSNMTDISYVNGLDTYKGGSHLKYVKNEIIKYIKNIILKKHKVEIKNFNINNNFMFGLSVTKFPKPEFDTQNKTRLINTDKEIKEYMNSIKINLEFVAKKIYDKFEEQFDNIAENLKHNKIKKKMEKVNSNLKNVKRIAQFIDAVDKDRRGTTLFIVEGDSAKSHFPIVRNKNKHGLFPLKGKILNAFNSSLSKILENKELTDLMNIIGLKVGENVDLKYFDKIAILTDADVDGDHIASMLMLFFYNYFPHLFKEGRIIKILSPIIICKKGKIIKRFYEYEDFLKEQHKYKNWTIEYNKGLGSLTPEEYALMLQDLKYNVLNIEDINETNNIIDVLFNKKNSDKRRVWLGGSSAMEVYDGV